MSTCLHTTDMDRKTGVRLNRFNSRVLNRFSARVLTAFNSRVLNRFSARVPRPLLAAVVCGCLLLMASRSMLSTAAESVEEPANRSVAVVGDATSDSDNPNQEPRSQAPAAPGVPDAERIADPDPDRPAPVEAPRGAPDPALQLLQNFPARPIPPIFNNGPGGRRFIPGARQFSVGGTPQSIGRPVLAPSATRRRLQSARQSIEQQSWGPAVRELQALLDAPEDALTTEDGKPDSPLKSVRRMTEQLLAELPPDGRRIYEQQFGPVARRELDAALADGQWSRVGEVVRRFFFTAAGADAAYRVASWNMDRERFAAAHRLLLRIRSEHPSASQFEPYLTVRTAFSLFALGRQVDASQLIARAVETAPDRYRRITIAGSSIAIPRGEAELREWLRDRSGLFAGRPSHNRNWTGYASGPTRQPVSDAGSIYPGRSWVFEFADSPAKSPEGIAFTRLRAELSNKSGNPPDREIPGSLVPIPQPIAVGDLAVFRTPNRMAAFRIPTGEMQWRSAEGDRSFLRNARARELLQGRPFPQTKVGGLMLQRLRHDATFGTLSTDGERVYAIDGLEEIPLAVALGQMPMPGNIFMNATMIQDETNRIVAYDAKGGKVVWEAGAASSRTTDPLAGVFFLGPPLPLDGLLYALGESTGDVRLFVLNASDGMLQWSQSLVKTDAPLSSDPFRKLDGLTPSFSEGVLVCHTGAGMIVGVDVLERTLLWTWSVNSPSPRGGRPAEDPDEIVPGRFNRIARLPFATPFGPRLPGYPHSCAPVIVGDRILVFHRNDDRVACLDLQTGEPKWMYSVPGLVFLAGCFNDMVLMFGVNKVLAVRLSDGELAWPEPVSISSPTGSGYVTDGVYYLPTADAEIIGLQVSDGKIGTRIPLDDGIPAGNLVPTQSGVVSLEPLRVRGFALASDVESETAARLAKNADDPAALLVRGELALLAGRSPDAVADFRRVQKLDPENARLQQLFTRIVLQGLKSDFPAYAEEARQLASRLLDPVLRTEMLLSLSRGHEERGELELSVEAMLECAFGPAQLTEYSMKGAVRVRNDRLIRGRVERSLDVAPVETAARIRGRIDNAFAAAVSSGNSESLQRLLSFVPGQKLDAAGLRLEWTRRTKSANELTSLEEQWIERIISEGPDDLAAEASIRLIESLIALHRPDDAAMQIRAFGRRFSAIAVRGKSKGEDLVSAWRMSPEVDRAVRVPTPWPTGRIDATLDDNQPVEQARGLIDVPLQFDRPDRPRIRLLANHQGQEFDIVDASGEAVWRYDLYPRDDGPSRIPPMNLSAAGVRGRTRGGILLAEIGQTLVAIDSRQVDHEGSATPLWHQSLVDLRTTSKSPIVQVVQWLQKPGGGRQFLIEDSDGHQIGRVVAVTDELVVLHRGPRMAAHDLFTGELLWSRDDLIPESEATGSEAGLFVAPVAGNNGRILSISDGSDRGAFTLPPLEQRKGFVGSRFVGWRVEKDEAIATIRNLAEDQSVEHRFSAKSLSLLTNDNRLVVVEPDGRVSLLDVETASVIGRGEPLPFDAGLLPSHRELFILPGEEVDVLLVGQFAWLFPAGNETTAVLQSVGIRPRLNGLMLGVRRGDAAVLWHLPLLEHRIDLAIPSTSPVIVATSDRFFQRRVEPATEEKPKTATRSVIENSLLCVDRATGRVIHEERNWRHYSADWTAMVDREQGHVDIRFPRSRLSIQYTNEPEKPARNGGADKADKESDKKADEKTDKRSLNKAVEGAPADDNLIDGGEDPFNDAFEGGRLPGGSP